MKKSKIGIIIMICIWAVMYLNPVTAYAKGNNTLSFGEPFMEEEKDYSDSVFATKVTDDFPSPYINSDGTFTVVINSIGYTVESDRFKVSDSSCTITLDAGPGSAAGSEYNVTLCKDGIVDTQVKKVTFYTGGVYQYTFTGLSTSSKYYLKFRSNKTTIDCFGSISNYVHIN